MNLSERDVSNLAEGRYNRRWRKAWIWGLVISLLVLAGMMTWESNTEGPYYKWTLPDGKEIIGEKSTTPMFYVDGELVGVVEEKLDSFYVGTERKGSAPIAPITILMGLLILGYLAFLLYILRQQRFAKKMVGQFKETGELPDTLVDYTPIKKEKKKK